MNNATQDGHDARDESLAPSAQQAGTITQAHDIDANVFMGNEFVPSSKTFDLYDMTIICANSKNLHSLCSYIH